MPSNLQGLYRLEFDGEELSFAAGTKVARAVKVCEIEEQRAGSHRCAFQGHSAEGRSVPELKESDL